MHSKIIQIATAPIKSVDYCTADQFYENSSDFADYIGDELYGDIRKKIIAHVAYTLSELFTQDGEALVYNGKVKSFIRKWYSAIKKEAKKLDSTKFDTINLHKVKQTISETHIGTAYRFYIDEWNGYAAPCSDLIDFVSSMNLKKGDKLYIGAVIDYHW